MAMNFIVLLSVLCAFVASIDGKPQDGQLEAIDAFGKIEFEDYSYAFDVAYSTNCKSQYDVTYMQVNYYDGYIYYYNIDFSLGAIWIDVSIADYNAPGHMGSIIVHLDSINGPVIANIATGVTGGSCEFKTIGAFLTYIPTGVHTVYFAFASNDHSHFIVDLDWFQFKESI